MELRGGGEELDPEYAKALQDRQVCSSLLQSQRFVCMCCLVYVCMFGKLHACVSACVHVCWCMFSILASTLTFTRIMHILSSTLKRNAYGG